MRRILVWAGTALGLLVLAGSVLVIRILTDMGAFTTLRPHFGGTCDSVASVPGAEDVAIDRERGLAFVSAVDFRAVMAGAPAQGRIAVIDLNGPAPRLLEAAVSGLPEPFHPHGLSFVAREDGTRLLFVVNHRTREDHAVEIFDVAYTDESPSIVHRASVTGEALVSPNDVAGLPDGSFYVANDHGSTEPGAQRREELLRLPRSTVLYHDGRMFRVVTTGLRFANGIALSNDGARVYVAETTGRSLRIYRRDADTGALVQGEGPEGLVWLGTAPDNIDIDETGALWVAAHPKFLALVGLVGDREKIAPSQIIKIVPKADGPGGTVDEVYLEPGEALSGATVGAVAGRTLVIGSAFEPHLLLCTLPETPGMLGK